MSNDLLLPIAAARRTESRVRARIIDAVGIDTEFLATSTLDASEAAPVQRVSYRRANADEVQMETYPQSPELGSLKIE